MASNGAIGKVLHVEAADILLARSAGADLHKVSE
jgi:hypothetical protein